MTVDEDYGTIRLLFNYIAQVKLEEAKSFVEAKRAIDSLVRTKSIKRRREGYSPFKVPRNAARARYAKEIMKKTISIQYHHRSLRGGRDELRSIMIHWIYPNIIIFNGRKDTVDFAVANFRSSMKERGFTISFDQLDFDWVFFLNLFWIRQRSKIWTREHHVYDNGYDPKKQPSVEIADGVELKAIHDSSSEWDIESTQAKKISAKDAGDSTEDLATLVSMLGGRRLKAVLIYVTMEEQSRLVRLSQGGRIYILKKERSRTKKIRKSETEWKRLIWGIEFTRRIFEGHMKWINLGEKRVPPDDVFVNINLEVQDKIEPILDNGLDNGKKMLEAERKRIRSKGVSQAKLKSSSKERES